MREGAKDHAFNTTKRNDKSTTPASSADRREGRLDDRFQERDLDKLKALLAPSQRKPVI